MTQKLGKTFGPFKDTSFIVIILIREFKSHAERRIIPSFTRFTSLNETPARRNTRCGGRIGENPKHLRQKTNSIILIFQWRTEFCTLLQLCTRIRSDEKKDLKEALHLILLKVKASTCCLISRHSVSVRQNSSSNPQNPGSTRYSQVWTWEEVSMNSECGSDQRTSGIESYVWFRRLWRSVSQRRMPRETEKYE